MEIKLSPLSLQKIIYKECISYPANDNRSELFIMKFMYNLEEFSCNLINRDQMNSFASVERWTELNANFNILKDQFRFKIQLVDYTKTQRPTGANVGA